MLGEELKRNIHNTWLKLRHKILSDPEQLHRRLARRHLKTYTQPPRAWCIAIRASDHRITPAHWVITPEHAMDLNHHEHPYEPIEHEVTIRKHGIRHCCHPISFSREDAVDVAQMFGVSRTQILHARRRGQFGESFYRGLGGKHGKPIPLLTPKGQLFDPCHREFSRPHPIWGPMWEFLAHSFPDDFEQTVIRRPFFQLDSSGTGTPAGGTGTPARHPHTHQPPTATQRLNDDYRFRGYHWLCPACKKPVRTIYYPLPVRSIFDTFYADPQFHDPVTKKNLCDADLPYVPPPTFACRLCHNIRASSSSIEPRFWNYVITHLTAGMLYGSEVPRPASLIPQRKRTLIRQLNRSSPIMRKVLTRFANGWTDPQIALDLLISTNAVRHHIRRAMVQEEVPDRHALAHKLNFAHSPPFNKQERTGIRRLQVKDLLLQGLTNSQIAEKLNQPHYTIARDVDKIYAIHGLRGHNRNSRKALANLLGIQLPPTKYDLLQQQIASLKLQGLTNIQIRHHLNLPRGTVAYYSRKIKHANQQTPNRTPTRGADILPMNM